ncbi:glycoside hydrolase 5 family protein [Paenibacillus sp. YAF4_2]|uniref:glycoside hydrolase 5 family protein n=1 Tax=Paenibacillus sp. YAF4_2 TaxID=3233085 RepID=UPI003F94512A
MTINKPFITRVGSSLYEGRLPFRFAGPNIYWLGLDENVGGVDWPTTFRVCNALDTAVEMGANVVRSHTLGASVGDPKSLSPNLGEYNEEAFRRVDYAIKEAEDRGLRLIIPFVCNWAYYHGGRETFTGWRDLTDRDLFYTNRDVIEDFKSYIAVILNRVNTYSGIAYKEDPTIMAWELGNELNAAPVEWVKEICDYIKSIDNNHLVAHGKQFQLDADKLAVDSLDILDVHYYPANAEALVKDAKQVVEAGKVYMAGEFGWPDCDLEQFLAAAEENEAVSGTSFWSLFPNADEGGYVHHFDGFSVHYPSSGINPDLAARIQQLRSHGYRMSGREVPQPIQPDVPVMKIEKGIVYFQGVVGAASYSLEKSTASGEGPWVTVYDKRPGDYGAPWIDPTRAHSVRTWYRLRAFGVSNRPSGYSEVIVSEPFTP